MAFVYYENISVDGASLDNRVRLRIETNSNDGNYNSQTNLYNNNLYAFINFAVNSVTPSNLLLNSNCQNTFSNLYNANFNLTNLSKRLEYDTTVKDASNMFAYDYNVTGNGFIPLIANNISGMYRSCVSLSGLQNTNRTYSYVEDASFFVSGCVNMSMEYPNIPKANNISHAFMNLKHLYNVGKIGSNVVNMQSAFVGSNLAGTNNMYGEVIIGNNVVDMLDAFFEAQRLWGVTSGPNVHTLSSSYEGTSFYGFDWNNFYTSNLWFMASTFKDAKIDPPLVNAQNGMYIPKIISMDLSKATQLQSMYAFMQNTNIHNNVGFPCVWVNSGVLQTLQGAFRTKLPAEFNLILQHCPNTVTLNGIFDQLSGRNRRIVVGSQEAYYHFLSNMGNVITGVTYMSNIVYTNATHYMNVNFYHMNGVLSNSINLRLTNTAYNETYRLLISYAPDLDNLSINSNLGVK